MLAALWLWLGGYERQEVRFESDGLELFGTLYLPRTGDTLPGAVFVHGSGPETREGYALYAQVLARRGIAALVYDKRGAGRSGGETYRADYYAYARDAAAALRRLQESPRVHRSRTGFVGYSEGEWVVPLALEDVEDAAFAVLVGGSAETPAEQSREEMRIRLGRRGFSAEAQRAADAVAQRVEAYVRGALDADALAADLARARSAPWFDAASDLPERVYPREDYAWWRTVMDFDSAPHWRNSSVPIRWIKGELDDRSRADAAAARFRRMVGPDRRLTIDIVPGADHLLLTWPLGVGVPPPRFANGYPRNLASWIHEQTRLD